MRQLEGVPTKRNELYQDVKSKFLEPLSPPKIDPSTAAEELYGRRKPGGIPAPPPALRNHSPLSPTRHHSPLSPTRRQSATKVTSPQSPTRPPRGVEDATPAEWAAARCGP